MSRPLRAVVWTVVLVLIVAGLLRLRFDVEVLNLLPGDIPAVKGLRVYQEHFANARELIIAIQAPDAEVAEHAAKSIAERLQLATNLVTEATWQPPWLEHPDQSAELIAYLWFNQAPEVFSALTNRFAPAEAARLLASAREQLTTSMSPGDIARFSYDPFGLTELPQSATGAAPSFGSGQEMFGSADGTFRIIFVQAAGTTGSYRKSLQWFNAIKELVESTRAREHIPPEVVTSYTGGPAFVSEISTGMEQDLRRSVGATVLIVVALFWWAHRRLKPLLWLLALLVLTLVCTLALGGLLFGTVNVVSVGFAAILMGLAVDYGLVLYHEAQHMPEASAAAVRRALAPSILWSAATTASAFLMLNFGGLPGLAQLGSFVGIGICVAAVVMLAFFLHPLLNKTSHRVKSASLPRVPKSNSRLTSAMGWIVTVVLLVNCALMLAVRRPVLDKSTNSLRPKHSPAYATMERIKQHLVRDAEPDWLIVSGRSESEVARKLNQLEPLLTRAVANEQVANFRLPTTLVPSTDFQIANRRTAATLAAQRDNLRRMTAEAGFTSNALAFTESALVTWERAASQPTPFWPTNAVSRWILEKVTARDATNLYALALVYPKPDLGRSAATETWTAEIPKDGVWLAGWERIGSDLLDVVKRDFWRVLLPVCGLLLISLWLAFRRWIEVALSLSVLLLSALCLWSFMALAGWSWNLLNLLALPLLLGSGVDYSIHLQLALRRHDGNRDTVRRSTGRALLLCAGTTIAGFGSNAWSSNAGLESLGLVCAAGIAFTFLVSFLLLPVWWSAFASRARNTDVSAPSSLYRSELWRAGLWMVRMLPRSICVALARLLAGVYWTFARSRRAVVVENLLPAVQNDRLAAMARAEDLFHQFAVKLVDLWHYEAGLPVDPLLGNATGWEHFVSARTEGRGVLLVTPHLGNWEFGGPWLTSRGVTLQVITLAEPGETLTRLRQASRSRWNIETLVVGNDPFAFLEIIKRLESGATVALLVDRPPPPTAVQVELFGRPFPASVAAAELARATGCVILPVYLPRVGDAYAAHILPAIAYDRPALRDRAARQQLTQEIMRAFEPCIRQYLDQWYHFVPIWPQ